MRVFVSEFLSGGASAGSGMPTSMRDEGLAMLRAVTADIARLAACDVVTTLEAGLSCSLAGEVIQIADAAHEGVVFQRLLREVDAVLVIAPETDGLLADRCRRVRGAGVESWNCDVPAIELCGDKLRLAEHLQSHGLPTIPTMLADLSRSPDVSWPLVLKPRDGAGSCFTFLVRNWEEWDYAAKSFREAGIADKCLMQPFVPGRALSIGVNIGLDGLRIECLPVGEQRLSHDGRFHYLGGTIPAAIPTTASDAINDIAVATCRTIPGLAGYIGMDFLLTDHGEAWIVEINPRLTTAYVGYRQLYDAPLPSRWLSPIDGLPLAKQGVVEFKSTDKEWDL